MAWLEGILGNKVMRSRHETAEVISKYLEQKTKKVFPEYDIVVDYHLYKTAGAPRVVFDVELPNIPHKPSFDRREKVIGDLKNVIPDSETQAGAHSRIQKTDTGFSVQGELKSIADDIRKNDKSGWNNCIYGAGISLG